MIIKPIYEFLLWNNCNNNCKFCWQKFKHVETKFLDDFHKEDSMRKVLNFIKSDKFVSGSHVLLVGGELFDTDFAPKLKDCFQYFLRQIVLWMKVGKIDLLYINTNLIYQDLENLYFFLKLIDFNGLFERLRFTTSYDIYGRFSSEQNRELMLHNLKEIKKEFPNIRIVVNSIMTKQFCEAVLNKEYSLSKFKKEYSVDINTIPYVILDPKMAASRKLIYDTLISFNNEEPGYLKRYVQNLGIPQKKIIYEYNKDDLVYMSSDDAECGHSENFKLCDIDKKRCFVCDIENLLKGLELYGQN